MKKAVSYHRYGALRRGARSAAADEFAAAYQSECRPEAGGLSNKSGKDAARPYGALKPVLADDFRLDLPTHQIADCVGGVQTLKEDGVDCLGDGHLH